MRNRSVAGKPEILEARLPFFWPQFVQRGEVIVRGRACGAGIHLSRAYTMAWRLSSREVTSGRRRLRLLCSRSVTMPIPTANSPHSERGVTKMLGEQMIPKISQVSRLPLQSETKQRVTSAVASNLYNPRPRCYLKTSVFRDLGSHFIMSCIA